MTAAAGDQGGEDVLDLFGRRVRPGFGRRGRPQHVPDKESRDKVQLGLALGWSNGRIAKGIGVSEPTLRKNYLELLKVRDQARDAMDLRRALQLWEAAESGNVGAMKAFDRFVQSNDQVLLSARERQPAKPEAEAAPVRAAPKGKKEAAVEEASLLIDRDPDLPKPSARLN